MGYVGNGSPSRGGGARDEGKHSHHKDASGRRGASRPNEAQEPLTPVWSKGGGGPVADNVKELVEQAHLAIYEGRVDDGERLMYEVLEYQLLPAVINNLALIQLDHRGKPAEALRLVNYNLEHPQQLWQPFTRALAARCCALLDRPEDARRFVEQAIRDFELGLSSLTDAPREERRVWREYTSKIMEATGVLGDDRWVWELYRRWTRHHVLASSHFHGGVAAFNLKRFRAAGTAWRRARKVERGFLLVYENVAEWCERGLVEPFALDYDFSGPQSPVHLVFLLNSIHNGVSAQRGSDDDEGLSQLEADIFTPQLTEYIRRPANRVFLLQSVLHPFLPSGLPREGVDAALDGVRHLIAAGEDWGEATAKRLLLSPGIAPRVKEAAAQGLMQTGRLDPDESVQMWVDGEVRDITLGT